MTDAFEATLSLEAIGALCDRLGIPGPVALQDVDVLRLDDPCRDATFGQALAALVDRGLVAVDQEQGGLTVAEEPAVALGLLASPEILITMVRQGWTVERASIGLARGWAAELWPAGGGDDHRLTRFPAAATLARVVAFCALVERPTIDVPALTITPARLLAVGDRVAGGDLPGAATLLTGCAGSEEAERTAFLQALVGRRAGCEVTVLDGRDPARLRGTVTTWLDGGDAGLWRIPPTDVSAPETDGGLDDRLVHELALEVRPVTRAELLAEIANDLPELGSA